MQQIKFIMEQKELQTIQKKVVEAIEEEIREPRWEGRVKFVEFYPVAEIDGMEIDLYMDENGKVEISLWKDNGNVEVTDEQLKQQVYDALPDWDLVRVDCETDGISRYDWCDPAFVSIDQVNNFINSI